MRSRESQTPMVSVIIPAYNCASFIDDTLESVYRQRYKNWELILVDDGSTDNTKAVLAPHMNRIRYYFQGNQGTAAARNAGLEKARGEVVAFLDHDDLWLPEKLELQVRAMQTWRDCGLVFTDGKSFDESGIRGNSLISKRLREWIRLHGTPDALVAKGWLAREFFFLNQITSASSVMARKECIDNVGGFDEAISVADDYDLWLRVSLRYPIVLLLSCLYLWRVREDSQSGPLVGRQQVWREASIVVIEKNWSAAPIEIRSTVKTHLSNMYWSCARAYFWLDRFRQSRKMLFGCLRYNATFVPAILLLLATYLHPSLIAWLRQIKRHLSGRWLHLSS